MILHIFQDIPFNNFECLFNIFQLTLDIRSSALVILKFFAAKSVLVLQKGVSCITFCDTIVIWEFLVFMHISV